MSDPNTNRENQLERLRSHINEPEYKPDAILKTRNETDQRVGEVIWPNDRAGEIVRLSNELSRLRQNQLMSIQNFQNGLIPSQFPMHDEVAKKYNEVQMQQLDAMQELIDAQKQAKLNETKAGNINAAREISQFNKERVVNYSKTIGGLTKDFVVGSFKAAGEGLSIVGGLLKGLLKGSGEILFALWGMGKDFKAKYPDKTDI